MNLISMTGAPYFFQQMMMSHDMVCMSYQQFQQLVLDPREMHFLTADDHSPLHKIHFDIASLKDRHTRLSR
jgi:hypothetical protein